MRSSKDGCATIASLIAAPTICHGQGLGSDDRLVVILDPFSTRRAGYRFEINLNGLRHNALYQDATRFQSYWNTLWGVATSIDGNSWVPEPKIPSIVLRLKSYVLRLTSSLNGALTISSEF